MAEGDVFLDPDYVGFYEWSCGDYADDVPFYTWLAGEHGGPVLEAACGTGRLTIPLARAGSEVVGFDASPPGLEAARGKLRREPPDVQGRVSLVEAELTSFDLGRQFASVFVPNSAIFHLQGRYSLTGCFRRLYQHTRPGGVAVVDVVAPHTMADQKVGDQQVVKADVNPATGLMTRELNRKLSIDWGTQIARVEHEFIELDGEDERRFVFRQEYRWLGREEGEGLLRRAGFPEVRTLGDFDGSKYTSDSPRLILMARRLDRDAL